MCLYLKCFLLVLVFPLNFVDLKSTPELFLEKLKLFTFTDYLNIYGIWLGFWRFFMLQIC